MSAMARPRRTTFHNSSASGRRLYIPIISIAAIIAATLIAMRGSDTEGMKTARTGDGAGGTSAGDRRSSQHPSLYEEGDWSSLWWLPKTGAPRADGVQVQVEAAANDLPHLMFVPKGDAPSGRWPLLVFLHGQGESSGSAPLKMVALQGPPQQAGRTPGVLPFAVLSPQKPLRSEFFHPDVASKIVELIRRYVSEFGLDEKRVYLTGLSQGGIGTWGLASDPAYSKVFAAIAPVCGGITAGNTERRAEELADTPIWAFHGANDVVLPVSLSDDAIEAVSKTKRTKYAGEAKFTRIPKTKGEDYAWKAVGGPFDGLYMEGHASWVEAYYPPGSRKEDTPPLYEWLLSFRREEGR